MSLNVKFLGAAGTVTGSRALLTTGRSRFLVDCGLFQGAKDMRNLNWIDFPVEPRSIEAVLLTHAHLDHSGYLPRLVRKGFQGTIYASSGTVDLCEILLKDAARLQEEDARYANESGYSNHKPALPLFDLKDVERCLLKFKAIRRREWQRLAPGLDLRLGRAGHITGASFLELAVAVDSSVRTLIFSGDVGHGRSRILRPPDPLPACDVLVLESTYGNRRHDRDDICVKISEVIRKVADRGGVLVIPSFAVGRTQELLFLLAESERRGLIPEIPVILDSPMGDAATDVFLRHVEDHLFDKAFGPHRRELYPRKFERSLSADESMMTAMRNGPMIVLAGAGMVNGGRILHHLKRHLPDSRNGVLFAGYQAEGTKGRFLLEKARDLGTIRIHHCEVPVEAEVFQISSLSAHGDYEDLLEWIGSAPKPPSRIFLNHGSPEAVESFSQKILEKYKVDVRPADISAAFNLA